MRHVPQILSLVGQMESYSCIYLIFENFKGVLNNTSYDIQLDQRKIVLYEILQALKEINDYGYSMMSLNIKLNVVEMPGKKYKILNLNYLAKHED